MLILGVITSARGIVIIAALIASLGSSATARAEGHLASSNFMLPLCKTWLKITVDRDKEENLSILKTQPYRLTSAGMCAGVVIGILESLRVVQFSCPPDGVTNEQLVQMVVSQIEKHPEKLHEDFVLPVSAVMIGTWPCQH